MCNNKIIQVIPTRFSAKEVEGRCGQTGIHGNPIFCDTCQKNGELERWERREWMAKYRDY